MMSTIFIIVLISFLFLLGFAGSLILFLKKELKKKEREELTLNFLNLRQDLESLKRNFGDGFSKIVEELGRIREIGHTLRDFQDFLRSPKIRGGIGEEVLKDLLAQVLPQNNFQTQYRFSEGETVDAIVKTKNGIIPIDSKFPMESFQRYLKAKEEEKEFCQKEFIRDIKKHIDDISRKYILPQEGTLDYAIMYIPAESIFTEIVSNHQRLLDYAKEKKVILVSPNTFYYFLKIILIGLEGAKIEEASRKILESLKALEQESLNFGKELSVLSGHIENVKKASERVQSRYGRLLSRLERIKMLKLEEGKDIHPEIEKPKEI